MAQTPGRPVDPTLHPRTRPEAEAIAMKMRGESDWFRHDGKNVEEPTPPPSRLATANAEEIADKNKGKPDEWFEHKPENAPDPPPKERLTEESRAIHDKVQGKDEKWYKTEENQDYYSPRPKDRITEARGEEIKDKNNQIKSSDWYSHENQGPAAEEAKPSVHFAEQEERKMKGQTGTPDWYAHDDGSKANGTDTGSLETPRGRPVPRFTAAEAGDYLERNKQGSVSSWYSHEHKDEPSPQNVASPRVTSSEGQAIASRLKGESENWYNYDQNKKNPPSKPVDKYRSPQAQKMVDRSRGGGMDQVMHMSDSPGQASTRQPRVKGGAEDIAVKNQQGLMDKYLNQEQNKGYNSARPAPRVKPEAEATKEKNKGNMDDCMQGYLPDPAKHSQKRVKAEAADNAQKNAGSMGKLMQGELPDSGRKGGRAVKPEAEMYASRNQGTLKGLMDNYGKMSIDRPAPKQQSSEAAAIAAKHKGSVAGCFSYDYS